MKVTVTSHISEIWQDCSFQKHSQKMLSKQDAKLLTLILIKYITNNIKGWQDYGISSYSRMNYQS